MSNRHSPSEKRVDVLLRGPAGAPSAVHFEAARAGEELLFRKLYAVSSRETEHKLIEGLLVRLYGILQ